MIPHAKTGITESVEPSAECITMDQGEVIGDELSPVLDVCFGMVI